MSKPNMANMAARIFNTPLMIDAEKASVIAQTFGPRMLGLGGLSVAGAGEASAEHYEARPEAGSLLGDGTYRHVKSRGGYLNYMGAAIVTVTGTLVRRGSYVGESSGMTSYEGIGAQIRAASEDDDVRVIAMEIDSFGGEAAGMFSLAEDIQAARKLKPVYAFLSDYALSAGYAIACQADHITIPPFGKAGSIGVVMMHADYGKKMEQDGVKVTLIHSGKHKVEGNPYEALPENVRGKLQSEGDKMWTAFAQLVETGRKGKVSMQAALETEAGVYMGQEAVDAGLVDQVAESKTAFAELIAQLNPPAASVTGATASQENSNAIASRDAKPVITGGETGADAPQPQENGMKDHVNGSDDKSPNAGSGDTGESAASAVAAERQRASKITDKVAKAGLPASFASKLISGDTPLAEAYEAILDEKAAKANDGGEINNSPSTSIVSDVVDRTKAGLTKALLARAGMDGGEQNEFTGMTLREMARVQLAARGITVNSGGVMALASAAFAPAAASGGMHSTSDFGHILADVANKSMLRGFEEAEEVFERFTSTGNLGDFKPTKRVGLDAFPSLSKIGEGQEFKYGTMGDYGETAMLATYGKLFAISRQTIINDDLGAFTRMPQKMGRAARRTVGDLVFAVLNANAAMADAKALFHSAHKNLATSTGVPSEATINAGINAMATQKDRGGKAALNVPAKFLLAPTKLRSPVLQALNSEYAPDDTDKAGTAKMPNAYNTVRGAAEPIFDARLAGNAWYLAADPSRFDTIEVSYLDGISTPFLDQQDGWSVDGTEFKVRIDAAATALAFEGLYKNAG